MSARGGKVFVLLDPKGKATDPGQPLLTQFLMDWGINAGDDIVLDASGMGQLIGTNDASVPVVPPPYPQHAITEGFGQLTGFPLARSMTALTTGSNGRTAQAILNTSPRSWAEADLAIARGRESPVRIREGRQAGTDYPRRRGVRAGHRRAAAALRQQQPGGA